MFFVSGESVWTDYPFVELGDVPGQEAPIREVTYLAYDDNKYALVRLPNGLTSEVKLGYLTNRDGCYLMQKVRDQAKKLAAAQSFKFGDIEIFKRTTWWEVFSKQHLYYENPNDPGNYCFTEEEAFAYARKLAGQ